MNKIIFAIAIFVSAIFADTIHLKDGREINDATVVKIGINEVEYKIGKREVLYTAKKSDIAIIFYKDGTKEVFGSDGSTGQGQQNIQNIQNTVIVGGSPPVDGSAHNETYENFTTGQRWATFGLNLIPGVGSIVIMDDWTGAIVQWVLTGGGVIMVSIGTEADKTYKECHYNDYRSCEEAKGQNNFIDAGTAMGAASIIYNIFRSITYDKPKKVAYNKYEGFNFAVLPDKHGRFTPYMTYRKTF